MPDNEEVTCKKCGWVHVGVGQDQTYEVSKKCFRCGEDYRNFRKAQPLDAPIGCTLQHILHFEHTA